MTARAVNHIHIRTANVAETAGFLHRLLGLNAVPAPGTRDTRDGCWMENADGVALLHIGPADGLAYPSDATFPFTAARGGGAVHHIALDCTGLAETVAHLEAAGVKWVTNAIPQLGMTQLFVEEWNGILLELNFTEAADARA